MKRKLAEVRNTRVEKKVGVEMKGSNTNGKVWIVDR